MRECFLLNFKYFFQIFSNTHKIVGAGRLFERKEANRLNPAITTHRGLAKGVRIVKNGDVKPSLALVADGRHFWPFF